MTFSFDSEVFDSLKGCNHEACQIIDAFADDQENMKGKRFSEFQGLKRIVFDTQSYLNITDILPHLCSFDTTGSAKRYLFEDQQQLINWIQLVVQRINLATFICFLVNDNIHQAANLLLSHLSVKPSTLNKALFRAVVDLKTRYLARMALTAVEQGSTDVIMAHGNNSDKEESELQIADMIDQALPLHGSAYGLFPEDNNNYLIDLVKQRIEKLQSLPDVESLDEFLSLDDLMATWREATMAYLFYNVKSLSVPKAVTINEKEVKGDYMATADHDVATTPTGLYKRFDKLIHDRHDEGLHSYQEEQGNNHVPNDMNTVMKSVQVDKNKDQGDTEVVTEQQQQDEDDADDDEDEDQLFQDATMELIDEATDDEVSPDSYCDAQEEITSIENPLEQLTAQSNGASEDETETYIDASEELLNNDQPLTPIIVGDDATNNDDDEEKVRDVIDLDDEVGKVAHLQQQEKEREQEQKIEEQPQVQSSRQSFHRSAFVFGISETFGEADDGSWIISDQEDVLQLVSRNHSVNEVDSDRDELSSEYSDNDNGDTLTDAQPRPDLEDESSGADGNNKAPLDDLVEDDLNFGDIEIHLEKQLPVDHVESDVHELYDENNAEAQADHTPSLAAHHIMTDNERSTLPVSEGQETYLGIASTQTLYPAELGSPVTPTTVHSIQRINIPSSGEEESSDTDNSDEEDEFNKIVQGNRAGSPFKRRRTLPFSELNRTAAIVTTSASSSIAPATATATATPTPTAPAATVAATTKTSSLGTSNNSDDTNSNSRDGQEMHIQQHQVKKRKKWSDDEMDALREGLAIYKDSQWSAILGLFPDRLAGRTSLNLRDKARNEIKRRRLNGIPLGEFKYAQ